MLHNQQEAGSRWALGQGGRTVEPQLVQRPVEYPAAIWILTWGKSIANGFGSLISNQIACIVDKVQLLSSVGAKNRKLYSTNSKDLL